MKALMKFIVGILWMLSFTNCNIQNDRQTDNRNKAELETVESNTENILVEKTEELDLVYYGMMCDCPQWATSKDIELYESSVESGNPIPVDSLFINVVPADEKLIHPFELDYNSLKPEFTFTGSFYKNKVRWVADGGIIYNNRVFQYSKCITKNK